MLPCWKHQVLIFCFLFGSLSAAAGSRERKPTTTWKKEEEEEPVMATDRQAKLLWRDAKPDILYYDSNADFWNRRSSDNYEQSLGFFSAVRASRDAQLGRLGRVEFDNTLTNGINDYWQNSIFQCKNAGLYFFTFAARGRASQRGYENDFITISPTVSSDEARRIRLQNSRSRQADEEACLDWKVSLMLNGESVISVGGMNNTSGSNTVILPLNRGDRVWLQLLRGQLVEVNGNSFYGSSVGYSTGALATFSGYQVSSLNQQPSNYFPSSTASGTINDIDDAIVIPSSRRNYFNNYQQRRYY